MTTGHLGKPFNADQGFKVNQGSRFSYYKEFSRLILTAHLKATSKVKTQGKKDLKELSSLGCKTEFKIHT